MAKGPRSFNLVTLLLILAAGAAGYGLWKFFPVYFTAWQVDHLLADAGARAYKINRLSEPSRSIEKEKLEDQLRREVRDVGVRDPEMAVDIDFAGDQFVTVSCDYREVVLHPIGGRYTIMNMHRRAQTSLDKPVWEQK